MLIAGCGPPPEPPEPTLPATPTSTATGSPPPTFPGEVPTFEPTAPSGEFSEQFAVDCGGEPSGDEVIDLLRAEDVVAAGADAEVTDGPRCSGTWQYTVVTVPDLDPLQVVTEGEPGDLELVTAGTDVCTPEIRIQAPPGIQSAAGCAF
ncbi:MAG TPA: hypothetical protein VIL37_12980 [Natronosporangium sp.]